MLLVTGGTGFIGGHLLERLSNSGTSAKCLLRRTSASRRLPAGMEPVIADLKSGDGLADALDGVDTVIHLAGMTKALRPQDYFAGNAQTTRTLAEALARRAIRLIHVSTLAAIGPGTDARPVTEDAEPHPLTSYGKSKLEAERIVRACLPQAVILRPAVVYGPRDTDVFQILRSVAKGLMVQIAGPERWFSAIYVADLIDALLAAACSRGAAGREYFLAHPQPVSWTGLGLAAGRIMGRTPRVVRVPSTLATMFGYCGEIRSRIRRKPGIISREKVREARCANWTCDTSRAEQELGFRARTSLEEGLGRTLAWYKDAGWMNY